jgi:hypothetical protein
MASMNQGGRTRAGAILTKRQAACLLMGQKPEGLELNICLPLLIQ